MEPSRNKEPERPGEPETAPGAAPGPDSGKAYAHLLRRLGFRATPQRIAILALIQEKDWHFTATQLHQKLRARGIKMELGTVYGCLNALLARDYIHEVRGIGTAEKWYDSNTRPHHHIWHETTQQLVDIPPLEIKPALAPPPGHVADVDVVVRFRPEKKPQTSENP